MMELNGLSVNHERDLFLCFAQVLQMPPSKGGVEYSNVNAEAIHFYTLLHCVAEWYRNI